MALLNKKYNFQKNGEVNVACNIYSTIIEAGSVYMYTKADGVIGLVPLVGTDDSRASAGRAMKGANTYAVARTGKPVYTEQRWTNPGTYTWTCPGGVTRCRLALCGGGSGGVCIEETVALGTYWSGTGGISKFGNLLQATGGSANSVTLLFDSESWVHSYSINSAGAPNGRKGGTIYGDHVGNVEGGAGFGVGFNIIAGNYGKGGTAGTGNPKTNCRAVSGNSGGYNSGYVNVIPGVTYQINVGAGGIGFGKFGDTDWPVYDNGNSGFALIAFGGDI